MMKPNNPEKVLARKLRAAKAFLASRRLSNTTADESLAPGYLRDRFAALNEQQVPAKPIPLPKREVA